jgi:acetolactate synthase I/II/III large subunit
MVHWAVARWQLLQIRVINWCDQTMKAKLGEIIEVATGAKLFVKKAGTGDELVVFLHAVGGDHSCWHFQFEALSKKYTCVSVDMRGHGKSLPPNIQNVALDISIAAFAKDTIALIEILGWRKAHLVGLSMGGVIALEIFRQNKTKVLSLTLANSWSFHPEAETRISFMTEQLSKMSLEESAAQLIPSLFAPGADQKLIEQAIKIEGTKNKTVFLDSWRSMFSTDYREMLAGIDVPVLLIGGSEDKVTPFDPLSTTINSQVPTSQLLNIDGAGHFSNLDHPEEFNRALWQHLLRARANTSPKMHREASQSTTILANTVAQALIAQLSKRGIEYLFSNSGTDFTPIIDALARYSGTTNFKLQPIMAPHENTAIAMAHGYYLLSGKPGCVMAHVNVGTANSGLGLINASRSRIPMLMMAGVTPWYESGVDGCRTNFVQWGQDTFDQRAYFREFTKWDYELKGSHNLETVIDRALAISQSDPQGPVYLTLPKEVLCEKIDTFDLSTSPRQIPQPLPIADEAQIDKAARLIALSKNPLILTAELGKYRGGVDSLVQLADRHAIAVIEFGKRNFFNFPTQHPMHLGFWPAPYIQEADLIIVIENPVPWIPALTEVNPIPTVIQIGVDPLNQKIPMRSFPADLILAGDPSACLRELTQKLDACRKKTQAIQTRYKKISLEHTKIFDTAYCSAKNDSQLEFITKTYLSYCIGQIVDDDVVIFNEYNLDPLLVPRHLTDSWFENSIASGLGWSLGAALGAQLACPDKTMIVTAGDGTYIFNTPLSAHYVASAYNLPILIIIFNDSAWSTIKKSYKSTEKEGWAVRKNIFSLCDFDFSIEFEKLAESCGGIGLSVDKPEQLPQILQQALCTVRQERKHVLVNVICKRDG